MQDVVEDLSRLRKLRSRAKKLLSHVSKDLAPFAHTIAKGTFRRKPNSKSLPNDINVTTTCSCLMALALTDELRGFYRWDRDTETDPQDVFQLLLDAPWMSSGLPENNAFTTTLIIRTLGFLISGGFMEPEVADSKKQWELRLVEEGKLEGLVSRLIGHSDKASEFLWRSLSDETRQTLVEFHPENSKTVCKELDLELRRILQSGWIFEESRFPLDSSEVERPKTAYELAHYNRKLLTVAFPNEIQPPVQHSLRKIAGQIADDPANFSINAYPPSSTVVYWFTDGISRAKIRLNEGQWSGLCSWAALQFNHERSLVLADHNSMMDPVSMAMSACLCARLRAICEHQDLGMTKRNLDGLPSSIELEHSIEELLRKQTNGIWPKYFPLFHYQEAGSNFCFTFEMLEAVLHEIGGYRSALLSKATFLAGLESAISWCEINYLDYPGADDKTYRGWNSGGDIKSLHRGEPESWATAVVHMFLHELEDVLSQHIRKRILEDYRSRSPRGRSVGPMALDQMLDIELCIREKTESLKTVLKKELVEPKRSSVVSTRRSPLSAPLSALLFGPPGTSKTEVAKRVAEDLKWDLVIINPSDFVGRSLENVYQQADRIFSDMMDLWDVVVFFDEMDPLTQTRGGSAQLDTATQFLTTSMLPKLAKLHDQGRVVFFMATNFQENFDPAIKRAGRFDLLLCMGPPTLKEKLNHLHVFLGKEESSKTKKAATKIRSYIKKAPRVKDQLELLTFGEFKTLMREVCEAQEDDTIQVVGREKFQEAVNGFSKYVTLRLSDAEDLGSTELDVLLNMDMVAKKPESLQRRPPIIQYLVDRKESKRQY